MKLDTDEAQLPPEGAKAPEPTAPEGDPQSPASDFHPIKIVGEPLSATILRERR